MAPTTTFDERRGALSILCHRFRISTSKVRLSGDLFQEERNEREITRTQFATRKCTMPTFSLLDFRQRTLANFSLCWENGKVACFRGTSCVPASKQNSSFRGLSYHITAVPPWSAVSALQTDPPENVIGNDELFRSAQHKEASEVLAGVHPRIGWSFFSIFEGRLVCWRADSDGVAISAVISGWQHSVPEARSNPMGRNETSTKTGRAGAGARSIHNINF